MPAGLVLPSSVSSARVAARLLSVVLAVAGVVQHVWLEAAHRVADRVERGIVQVLRLDPACTHGLVQCLLDGADLLFAVQRPLVVGRGDHDQDAQGQCRGRRVQLGQAVRPAAEQEAALQGQELRAVVQVLPRQPPQRGGVAVHGQGQPGLAAVGVVVLEKRLELRAVAEEQAVHPPAVTDQLVDLLLRQLAPGRVALDRLVGVARHGLVQHPLRLQVDQQVLGQLERAAAHLRAVARVVTAR